MLAGSEGLGGIEFAAYDTARSIGTVALLVILFAGGLDTDWSAVRPVLAPGLVLATGGVIATTLILAGFAWFALATYASFGLGTGGLSWLESLLLAAIVSSTDAAAVFSVYRTSRVQPARHLRSLLEFESGSNDPMAVLLTTALLAIMTQGGSTPWEIVGTLVLQFAVGGLAGGAVGYAGAQLANRVALPAAGLYPILVLALGFCAFGLAEALSGNGFLAVYTGGLVIGNTIARGRAAVMGFHDGLSWLMQIGMFIMLGLLVFPSQLFPLAGVASAIALFLMFAARPLSVLAGLLPFRMKRNELSYVSWVGLRGSVPIVLATFPAAYGVESAETIFHLVFFIVLLSVGIQGLTLVPAARWLRVADAGEAAELRAD